MLKRNGEVQLFIIFVIEKNFKIYYAVIFTKFVKFGVFVDIAVNVRNLKKLEYA